MSPNLSTQTQHPGPRVPATSKRNPNIPVTIGNNISTTRRAESDTGKANASSKRTGKAGTPGSLGRVRKGRERRDCCAGYIVDKILNESNGRWSGFRLRLAAATATATTPAAVSAAADDDLVPSVNRSTDVIPAIGSWIRR